MQDHDLQPAAAETESTSDAFPNRSQLTVHSWASFQGQVHSLRPSLHHHDQLAAIHHASHTQEVSEAR